MNTKDITNNLSLNRITLSEDDKDWLKGINIGIFKSCLSQYKFGQLMGKEDSFIDILKNNKNKERMK